MTAELRRQGRRVNPKRVCRLMRLHGICGIHKRRKPRWKVAGGSRPAPANLVRRDFRPGPPDRVWAGDITYIPTVQGWLYEHQYALASATPRRYSGRSVCAKIEQARRWNPILQGFLDLPGPCPKR